VIKQIRHIANSLKHHSKLEIKGLESPEDILIPPHLVFNTSAVKTFGWILMMRWKYLRAGMKSLFPLRMFYLIYRFKPPLQANKMVL
jgi:hypothetical protein